MTEPAVVTIFGASTSRPGDPDYAAGERLGRLLAEHGYTVMTGGYGGAMEAASKGARAAGGHVVGVTVARFEGPGKRPGPNPYVDEVIRYDNLRDRLYHLVARCDAAVALPGGIGTLSEIALTWSLLQVGEIGPHPFVLFGDGWPDLLTRLYNSGDYIRAEHMGLWQSARTPEEAVNLIENWRNR